MKEQTITNVPVENSQQTLKKNKTKIFSLIALIAMSILVTANFIFSLLLVNNSSYHGNTESLFEFCLLHLALLIPILIIYFKCNRKFNIAQIVLFSIFIVLSIIVPILAYYTNTWTFTDYNTNYYYHREYGSWDCLYIFFISLPIIILATLTYIFNLITFARERKANRIANNNSTKAEENNTLTFDTSNMVKELTEVKTVYDQKLITEEEYNNIRASIIAKYYKQ